MKSLGFVLVVSFFFAGCSTMNFGGSASTSATYVSKTDDIKASSKTTSSSSTQSEIDMKVQDIRNENDSRFVKKYINKSF